MKAGSMSVMQAHESRKRPYTNDMCITDKQERRLILTSRQCLQRKK